MNNLVSITLIWHFFEKIEYKSCEKSSEPPMMPNQAAYVVSGIPPVYNAQNEAYASPSYSGVQIMTQVSKNPQFIQTQVIFIWLLLA